MLAWELQQEQGNFEITNAVQGAHAFERQIENKWGHIFQVVQNSASISRSVISNENAFGRAIRRPEGLAQGHLVSLPAGLSPYLLLNRTRC